MQNDRILFRLLADPIKNYLTESGMDELQAGIFASTIAQRQFDNISSRLEVVPKKEKPEE